MINETSIRCFLTLARTLNFTQTAKQMYMTQQSVSKYIAKLEEDLGFRLFNRSHHRTALTKAGENYYRFFSEFDEKFGDVTEQTRRYYSNMYSSLCIGYLEWLELSGVIGAAIRQLKERIPDLHFTGEKHPQQDLIELFYDRKLDLIITYSEFAPKGSNIRKLKVLDTPLVLLVSPDNPRAVPGAAAEDFKSAPFIKAAASHETLSESKARARLQCRELGFTPTEILISPNLESAYMATELGQGVLVSTMLSRMSLHSELRCYPVGRTEELQCFWYEDHENPAVAAFASCLENSRL